MARVLAVVETMLLFVAATIMSLLWGHTPIADWIDVAGILGSAAILALGCGVAFYYNDLYDLRLTRGLAAFATRLIQSIGVAFILLAGFYTVFPDTRPAESAFLSSFLIVGLLLVPLRFAVYAALRSRPLVERVLILGASELTLRIIDEIDFYSVREAFGAKVVEHYLHLGRLEQHAYDQAVTDWELDRNFERI